jgi:hypothetical protein
LVNCARFYSYIDDEEKYQEVIAKLTSLNVELDDGEDLIVKGWRLCSNPDPEAIVSSYTYIIIYNRKKEINFLKHMSKNLEPIILTH